MEAAITEAIRDAKIDMLCTGVHLDPAAEDKLSRGGTEKLTVHEYATTGGVTLELENHVYVNAPFDEWFCKDAAIDLVWEEDHQGFSLRRADMAFPVVRILPLPGYLEQKTSSGHSVADLVMSHTDRIRVSPIHGCSMRCQFCELPTMSYTKQSMEDLLEGLTIAQNDDSLPPHHVLISGGTGTPTDAAFFDAVCERVVEVARMPVDVMMTPRREVEAIDRLVSAGIHGFALNLEVFDPSVAKRVVPQKNALGRRVFTESITRAIELTGGKGRVRSLMVVGLESIESTCSGVEYLARLGCDPVLSPFRPARGIPLSTQPPPSPEFLRTALDRAEDISKQYGVKLGPRCIPCQHNTLTLPDLTGDYFFS